MRRSQFTIIGPASCRLTPEERQLIDRAAAKAGSKRTDILRLGALSLAVEVLEETPPLA